MSAFPDRQGLQPERTALAWQRTAVTANVVIVPLVVVHARLGAWALALLGSIAVILASALVVGAHHRFSELRDDERGYSPLEPMLRVAGVTVLAGLAGAATGVHLWWS